MNKRLVLIIFFSPILALAQPTCKVLLPALDSVYLGKCKNGLAHGTGEAWGDFYYNGRFSKGYPKGIGKAEYPDGCKYIW